MLEDEKKSLFQGVQKKRYFANQQQVSIKTSELYQTREKELRLFLYHYQDNVTNYICQ